jgi:hypothetical protein
MTTTQNTAGQVLTATLRRYFSVGTSTRRYRKDEYGRRDMHAAMIEAITFAATLPGYYSEGTQDALSVGFGVALAYDKHVKGYRVDGMVAQRINAMSAWQFAGLLGQMVDAGVENAGTGERFFAEMRLAA